MVAPQDYHIVRAYLERFGDLAILADVVGVATSSLDPIVLASAADTINFHMKTFRAIGAFDPLFGRIATRYAAIRTIRFPERELLLSLSNLARVARADSQLQQLLSYDLSRFDQKNSIAACSPASDNMGEVMLTSAYSDDEIERILSSGTSMDQQMMARVLRKIINNLDEHISKAHLHFESYPTWFHRLRSFDESTFETVLNEWLNSCFLTHQVGILQAVVPTLVGSGCLAMSAFLEVFRACVAKLKNSPSEGGIYTSLRGLQVLLPSDKLVESCSPQDAYRYRLEQHKLCQETGSRVVQCIFDTVELASTIPSPKIQQHLSKYLCTEPVLSITKQCVVSDPGCLSRLSRGTTCSYFKPLLDLLLDPVGRLRK